MLLNILTGLSIRIQTSNGDLYAYNWFWNNTSGGQVAGPYVTVTDVDPGSTVTLKGYDFPADHTFELYMGSVYSNGIGGTYVTLFTTGAGGEWTATFDIPSGLQGNQSIAVRLESTTDGYVVTNWFWNRASDWNWHQGDGHGSENPAIIPNIFISSVVKDTTVTISAVNFPKDTDFVVLMGAYGTYGMGGTQVDSFNSEDGGDFTVTFDLPAAVKGMKQVAIRIQSDGCNGFYAYNWFWNTTV